MFAGDIGDQRGLNLILAWRLVAPLAIDEVSMFGVEPRRNVPPATSITKLFCCN